MIRIGAGLIGTPLRSVVRRAGGSIHRIASVDEIGSVVQALRHEAFLELRPCRIAPRRGRSTWAGSAPCSSPAWPMACRSRLHQGMKVPGPVRQGAWHGPVTRLLDTDDLIEIELEPFQAQEQVDFEFVLGLSRPLRDFAELTANPELAPRLRLYQDGLLTEHLPLDFESLLSRTGAWCSGFPPLHSPWNPDRPREKRQGSPPCGMFQVADSSALLARPGGRQPQGNGPGRLHLQHRRVERPRVQLLVSVRGAGGIGVGGPVRHPVQPARNRARGRGLRRRPVLNPDLRGLVERINPSTLARETFAYQFRDDGVYPDLLKADGVSAARIALTPSDRRTLSEYRVWIQASSSANASYIPLVDPVLGAGRDTKEKDRIPPPPPVPSFQRATSLDFHLRGTASQGR